MPKTPFEKVALSDINITFKRGEFAAIIGRTGSGKSTLVQHMNGLVLPTTGTVTFDGMPILKKNFKEIRHKVGFVFQYPEHQLFEETVYKDIAFGLKNRKLPKDEEDRLVKLAAEKVGIGEELLEKSVYELSGGQKRRVAIAGVIVMEPEYLILDEPASGLDPEGKEDLMNFLVRMNEENGMTIILVTHSMDDAAEYGKRIIAMSDSHIMFDGTPKQVFSKHETLRNNGLDVPSVTRLFLRLSNENINVSGEVFTLEEALNELLRLRREGVLLI